MTLADDLTKAEEALQEFYRQLRAIPWWHFRKANKAARKYNNQLHLVWDLQFKKEPTMIKIRIWFTDSTDKEVLGYHYWVDNGLLKIQTSSRQGGPESYEYYPLVNIKQWSI